MILWHPVRPGSLDHQSEDGRWTLAHNRPLFAISRDGRIVGHAPSLADAMRVVERYEYQANRPEEEPVRCLNAPIH